MSETPEPPPPPDPRERDPLDLARDITDRYRKSVPAGSRRAAPPKRRRPRLQPGTRGSRDEPLTAGEALAELIREQGWARQLDAQSVFTDWGSIVGPDIAAHSEVVAYRESVVHIQADSTAWAKEIKLLAPRIVAKLNELLGDGSVLRIDVRGPQAPSWKSGPYSVKGRGPRDTYG